MSAGPVAGAPSGAARVAGVMGWPVEHSRSPVLHGYWLRAYGIDGAYVPLPVRPEALETAVRALPALGFAGVNLTVPHKEAARALMDELSPAAERIGAVNTVIVDPDSGRLRGDNTDGFGFMAHLRASAPGWSGAAPVVLIGAGGAARALLSALLDAGVPVVRLTNRTRARAEALAAEFGARVRVIDWGARAAALDGAGLLVNGTSLGMAGQPGLDLALDALPRDAVVYDIVYAPLETALLAAARARGHPAVDGLGMLLHQARPAFRAWFGRDPEVTEALRRAVLGGDGA